jgi:hypothetical protein
MVRGWPGARERFVNARADGCRLVVETPEDVTRQLADAAGVVSRMAEELPPVDERQRRTARLRRAAARRR